MLDTNQILLNNYQVLVATNKDEDHVLYLLKDVASWLKENNIDQWSFLSEGGEDQEIRQAVTNGETFVIKKNEKIVGTFTLYQSQSEWDQHIWGISSDNAVYLHRLAITRSEIGSSLGNDILQWIQNYIKSEGITLIRLDCVENNNKLNAFYLNSGFEKVGINDEHSKFEKRL
ncbi:GNAT family N-acetyltransferase [Bacillus sp. 166amftsu]|uniref:GNAT family N-acetyltransferase n=1 Tax=Bacillus sp. 166amftsu TaxID=1761753 RepID=UPI000894A794|nr:GNAT family N-acetyltransferase [Bacillus sp. 166amftsu]SDZ37710.1 Acetyltransferase (GNAT) domain-containing protein [Bacillus sp. 166amftsu]